MPRHTKPNPCTWTATCSMVKRLSKAGQWHSLLNCRCSLHTGHELTIYLFDKRITDNPIYRAYEKGQEPKGLKLGRKGYYIMERVKSPVHLLNVARPGTICGRGAITVKGGQSDRVTTSPKRVTCPDCERELATPTDQTGCYCVCHNPLSSRPWCIHCEGKVLKKLQADEAKANAMLAESVRDIFAAIASEVADEFYPKGNSGDRRSEYIRDAGVMLAKLQAPLCALVKAEAFKHGLMATSTIIEDIDNEQGQNSPLHKDEVAGGERQ